jgi:hypothetical protein
MGRGASGAETGRSGCGIPAVETRERARPRAPFPASTMETRMTAKAKVKTGDDVTYTWGKGTVSGEVTKVHTQDVKKTIKGNTVKRAASTAEPALEIKTAKGKTVLKSASEVTVKSA